MCFDKTKFKQNFFWVKREVSMLSFRRYLSDYHARRWIDYEKILMMRTMCSTFSRIILSALAVATGTENWHLTQEYIDKGGLPNEEFAI